MENIYYWIGFVIVWLSVIAGTIGLAFLFLPYIIERMKDNLKLANYLLYRKDFNFWYWKIHKNKRK